MRLMSIAGVNTIQTYIAWNFHCSSSAQATCNFSGDRNITHFFELAKRYNLSILLRPGPYICAEWDLGGFPWWLLAEVGSSALRTSDERYLARVAEWYHILMPKIKPYLYAGPAGGPIVMVQVENEYGSFGNDKTYLSYLRDLLRAELGSQVLLYSTDANSNITIANTAIPGVFQAVDFFYYMIEDHNVTQAWENQHSVSSRFPLSNNTYLKGPNFNDEFYPGWLSQWFDPWVYNKSVEYVLDITRQVLEAPQASSNLNFYMFFGGTNFGFWSGRMVTTSYDYSAPINESGHPNPKLFLPLQKLLQAMDNQTSHIGTSLGSILPPPLQNYGTVAFTEFADVMDTRVMEWIASSVHNVKAGSPTIPTTEELGQGFGYTMYSAAVKRNVSTVTVLSTGYAAIYVDGEYVGFVFDGVNDTVVLSSSRYVESIWILFESVGRINCWSAGTDLRTGVYAIIASDSGVFPPIGLMIYTMPMDHQLLSRIPWQPVPTSMSQSMGHPGLFLRGTFQLNTTTTSAQGGTLLDMSAFGKGFVVVNGHNLGRYWTTAGPQKSLFCPASYLNFTGNNEVLLFEQELSLPPLTIRLVAKNFNV